MGNLYQNQGKYDEARPHYLRALKIRKKQLGSKHPDAAIHYSILVNSALHKLCMMRRYLSII